MHDELSRRAASCFLCRWILEDLKAHGELTDEAKERPNGEKPLFPKKAKEAHLKLEGIALESPA